ncbi:MAG: 5'-3' exonuclease H3TH domain-containing protein, partial [Pseudomonadota bacterium]|nr:5'-3' exonuclease H3TH domain-containing protein [Pseudomonadota bacterium]
MSKLLCLIDTSALVYRAFHAIRPLTTSTGQPTNALFGFCQMLMKVLEDFHPTHVAAALDLPGPTWRHQIFPAYKAQRPPMDPDLAAQFPFVPKLLEAFGLPGVGVEGFEADDIIATLTHRGREAGCEIMIISGDKDLMSLVDDGVVMFDSMKNKRYDLDAVKERHGVTGERLLDLLALAGDSADNIPGVPGVGPKTALKLLAEFGDLQNLLRESERIERKSWREKMLLHKDEAELSRRLVTLSDDVEVGCGVDDLLCRKPDHAALKELFAELEFHSLSHKLSPQQTVARDGYRLIDTPDKFSELLKELAEVCELAVDTETTSVDPMSAALVGISLAWTKEAAVYIPVGHDGVVSQLDKEVVLSGLRPWLGSEKV